MTMTAEQRKRRLDLFARMSAEEDDYPAGGIATRPDEDDLTAAGRKWNPEDHPRDTDGRFIEKGAVLDLLKKAVATVDDVTRAADELDKTQWSKLKPEQKKHITDSARKLPASSEARKKLESLGAKVGPAKKSTPAKKTKSGGDGVGEAVVPAIIYKKNADGAIVAQSPDGKKQMRWDAGQKKYVVEDENGKQLASLTKTAAYKAVKDSKRWVAPGQTDVTPVQEEPVEADIPEVTSANVDEDIPEVTPSSADEVTLPVVEVPVVEPVPKQVFTPTPGSITGKRLNRPLIQNTWGYTQPGDPVSFHPDGELGNALLMMGDDVFMDVDGEPLGDVIGKLATQAVVGDKKMQQVLDELEQLHQRLPVGSQARNALFDALDRLRAPNTPEPVLPSGTPEPLQQLMSDLHAVPIVRNDPSLEEQPLVKIAQLAAKGASTSRLVNEVRKLANRRHESIEGKPEIDRAVQKAIAALQTGQISTKVESPAPPQTPEPETSVVETATKPEAPTYVGPKIDFTPHISQDLLDRIHKISTDTVIYRARVDDLAEKLRRENPKKYDGFNGFSLSESDARAQIGPEPDFSEVDKILDEAIPGYGDRYVLKRRIKERLYAEAKIDGALYRFAQRNGLEISDKLKEDLARRTREAFANKKIAVRVTPNILEKILADGRFKSQFESGTSKGKKDFDMRARIEELLFGITDEPHQNPEKRPVYGYVAMDGIRPAGVGSRKLGGVVTDALSQYGNVQVILKDSVRSRTTAMFGDSLNNHFEGLPSPVDDPAWYSFTPSHGGITGGGLQGLERSADIHGFRADSYAEAQIHGGVSVDDIEEVILPSASAALQKALDAKGIRWRVLNWSNVHKVDMPREEREHMLRMAEEDVQIINEKINWYHKTWPGDKLSDDLKKEVQKYEKLHKDAVKAVNALRTVLKK